MSAQDRWDDEEIDRLIQSSLNVEPSGSFLSRVRTAVAEMTVDQHIQEALNVDPSPEFVARIRQHVEAEKQYVESGFSRIFSKRWALAAGGLAAAAALFIAVPLTRPATDQPAAPAAVSATATAPEAPPPAPAPTMLPDVNTSPSTQPPNTVAVKVEPRSDPEVMVSRQEIRAFREYWTRLSPDAFNTTAVAEREGGAEPLPAVEQLTIEPIVVNPIDPSTE